MIPRNCISYHLCQLRHLRHLRHLHYLRYLSSTKENGENREDVRKDLYKELDEEYNALQEQMKEMKNQQGMSDCMYAYALKFREIEREIYCVETELYGNSHADEPFKLVNMDPEERMSLLLNPNLSARHD